jgi:hypothetical protein
MQECVLVSDVDPRGSLLRGGLAPPSRTLVDVFRSTVEQVPDEPGARCWQWLAYVRRSGRGRGGPGGGAEHAMFVSSSGRRVLPVVGVVGLSGAQHGVEDVDAASGEPDEGLA